MARRVVFSPAARAQLVALHRGLSERASPAIGESYTSAIVDYCQSLETFPHRGTRRDDIRPGLRTIGFRRRVTIAFFVEAENAYIVGIYYGGQNYDEMMRGQHEDNG